MSQQRIIESEHNDFYKKIVAIKDGKMKKEGLILIEGEDLIDEARKVGALQYALTYDPKFIVNDVPTTLVKQGLYRNLASYPNPFLKLSGLLNLLYPKNLVIKLFIWMVFKILEMLEH